MTLPATRREDETPHPEIEVEKVQLPSTEVVSGAPVGFVLTDPAALTASLQAYTDTRRILLNWIDTNLVAGVDYMLIHRKIGYGKDKRDCPKKDERKGKTCPQCHGKATLCKPGAEKMCGLLRLRPTFRQDRDTWEMLGRTNGVVAIICELANEAGEVVAEGRGCRDKEQDYGDLNKTVKMVQKSAQTDAVLWCGGLSEVFTQDLDDALPTMPGAEKAEGHAPSPLQPPRRKSEQKPPDDDATHMALAAEHASIEIAGEPTTDRFLKRPEWTSLVEIAKRHGKTSAMLRLYLKNTHNILDEKTVPFSLLEELTAWCGVKAEEA